MRIWQVLPRRLRRHDHAVAGEDFVQLPRWLRAALPSAAPDGSAR